MTADLMYRCYSTVSNYKIIEGCVCDVPAIGIGISNETIIVEGTTSKHLKNIFGNCRASLNVNKKKMALEVVEVR
jgi:hypothetical protein